MEVAAALGTDHQATDRPMNALCAMGLLEKKKLRPTTRSVPDKKRPTLKVCPYEYQEVA